MKAQPPTLKDILSRGFLPQELPPPFNSLSFGHFIESRGSSASTFDTSQHKTSRAEVYNLARAGSFRRKLAILNPIHYALLAECIVTNWKDIAKLVKSQISLTTPTPAVEGRAIARLHPLDILPRRRAEKRSRGAFLLRADVARFYPSVYTHSIPWAVHGKAFSKANRDIRFWGNKLDLLVRNCQDGQTIGIPVGPDTSLVISEVILARIDKILSRRRIHGLRYIDDYELTFQSEEQALKARSVLQEALLEFELDLNNLKTLIHPLPQSLEDSWIAELNQFQIAPYIQHFETKLIRFFDRAFQLAHQNPREGVLKYAAGRVINMPLTAKQVALTEDLLMQCAQVEAGTLSFVLVPMLKYPSNDQSTLNRRRAMLLQLIEKHGPQRHSSEVAWALWACIVMDLSLPQRAVKAALGMEDSICSLLLLHAKAKKLIDEPKDLMPLREEMNGDGLYGPRWMLAYEANVKRWFRFQGSKDYVAKDKNFHLLKKAGVTFYDESRTTLPEQDDTMERGKVVDTYLSRVATGYGSNPNEWFDEEDEFMDEDEPDF